jgi:PEP-CTERM motif
MNKISSAPRMRRLLFAVCASVAMAVPAAADIIVPPPYIEVNGGVGNFGTFSSAGSTITLTSTPNPSITASTTGLGPNDSANEYDTEGVVGYYVVITGGQQGDPVPLIVTGSLSTSASGGDAGDVISASAAINLSFYSGNYGASESVGCGNVARGEDCSNPTWSGSLTAIAGEGYSNFISITTTTVVESSGTAYAFADPVVAIDPTFLAANPEYSLALNVGNTPTAAPEPSTLMLASGCLLGLVFARRKKLAF